MRDQTDPLTRLGDTIRDLVEPVRHAEAYWHTKQRRSRLHVWTHAPLLDQLRASVDPDLASHEQGERTGGRGYTSKAAANLDAVHRLGLIAAGVDRHLPRNDRPLEERLRALVGHAATLDATAQARLAGDADRWWTWCRILGGWQDPPWRPTVPCPTCGQLPGDEQGLRVRLDLARAICLSCDSTWDPNSIYDLAAHIRAGPTTKDRRDNDPHPHRAEGPGV